MDSGNISGSYAWFKCCLMKTNTTKVVIKITVQYHSKHQQLHKQDMAQWELLLQTRNGSFWSRSRMPDCGASLLVSLLK